MPPKPSARVIAWELLHDVFADGAYANLVWSAKLGRAGLQPADKGFATELAYGTLRHTGQLEAIITEAGGRTPDSVDPEVWWVLLLGCYQVTHMATPAHAAVDESVKLVRQVGKGSASGLVNAILRKVALRDLEGWITLITADRGEDERLALRYAHPPWIVEELRLALRREGRENELEELLGAHNMPARVTATILPGLATIASDEHRTPYSPLGVYLTGDPALDPRVHAGTARIQDEGSQLAALICGREHAIQEGERILDACSGPGGKSAVLASEIVPRGASLTSVELQPHRARLVHQSLSAFGETPQITVVTADVAEHLAEAPAAYDRILLDAPCLGLGALRRRPEARWTKTPGDKESLQSTQRRLLSACLDHLSPGGHLTYVTCSPVVSETTELIAEELRGRNDVVTVDTFAILQGLTSSPIPDARVGDAVQLWPHRHGTDAMFIQVLAKTSQIG